MGIKNLNNLLKQHCNYGISEIKVKDLKGTFIAIDTSIFLYKYTFMGNMLQAFTQQILHFLKNNITPVYLFDGKPGEEKKELIKERKEKYRKKAEGISILKETQDTLTKSIEDLKISKDTTENKVEDVKKEIAYASFGMEINDADALTSERMMGHYKTMKEGDTINSKMSAKINEVCSAKGCWMTLDMDGKNEVMVKFKDYGFFMPLNAEGEVVINGKAFVSETSVEELRHYAEDAGKSEEEIAAITEPKRTLSFEADGVLLKQ